MIIGYNKPNISPLAKIAQQQLGNDVSPSNAKRNLDKINVNNSYSIAERSMNKLLISENNGSPHNKPKNSPINNRLPKISNYSKNK